MEKWKMCYSSKELGVSTGAAGVGQSIIGGTGRYRIAGLPDNLTYDEFKAAQPGETGYAAREAYQRYRKLKGTHVAEGEELPPAAPPGPAVVSPRIASSDNRVGAGDLRIKVGA